MLMDGDAWDDLKPGGGTSMKQFSDHDESPAADQAGPTTATVRRPWRAPQIISSVVQRDTAITKTSFCLHIEEHSTSTNQLS